MEYFSNINNFFSSKLKDLNCDENTKAYIVGLFSQYKNSNFDYSKESITLLYSEARYNSDFEKFNSIADWIFFCNSLFPEYFHNASEEYYHSIGRLSYYSCYKLINRQWKVYERLADDFTKLSENVRTFIR